MKQYDPSTPPAADEWLALSEDERIELVRSYHETYERDVLNDDQLGAHSAFHVIVENQIAMKYEAVALTVEKLIRQGLGRHEAVHAIGAVLSGVMWEVQNNNSDEFDSAVYRRRLAKLTVKRWRKGQF